MDMDIYHIKMDEKKNYYGMNNILQSIDFIKD